MDIRFDRQGPLAVVTLDRPHALNSLTLVMATQLDRHLAEWAGDPGVFAVVIRGAGGRAFCAGGDIRVLYDAGKRGDPYAREFYRTEYRLNQRIKTYGKPYIALVDGIVMGGGVGLSIHGSHRVVTERCQFAMPETGIGFFPDVGGSWFLPRCPGATGTYLGLAGARIGAADMRYCGLATHQLSRGELEQEIEEMARASWTGDHGEFVTALLDRRAGDPDTPSLAPLRAAIDRCFGAGRIEDILLRLDGEGSDWARETATALRRKSPTSLKVTLRQLRLGTELGDFASAMRMEYRLARRFMDGHDFYEGVRAAVIDRDQAPRWRPASLAKVDDAAVNEFFAPLDEPDLDFPSG